MPPSLDRERLLVQLRRRHDLALIALESPAGFGRSVLLDQALAEGPSRSADLDLFYRVGPDNDRPGALARALLGLCGTPTTLSSESLEAPRHAARILTEALSKLGGASSHVSLMIDNVERGGDSAGALLGALIERLDSTTHLVLSGRRLPRIGLAREIAAGRAILLSTEDLAFRADELTDLIDTDPELTSLDHELMGWPAVASLTLRGHPELVRGYIEETVLGHTDPLLVKALAAVAAVEGCAAELLNDVIGAVIDRAPATADEIHRKVALEQMADELAQFPLVGSSAQGCWPHPLWADVTRHLLSADERSNVIAAKTFGLLSARAFDDAGRLALSTGDAGALRLAVRAALSSVPHGVPFAVMAQWADSELLPRDSLEAEFMAAVIDLNFSDVDGTIRSRLETVREGYEAAQDDEGEVSVLLLLGQMARRRDDRQELSRLLARASVLAERGSPVAQGLVALGKAVAAQMTGNNAEAVRVLELVPPGSLVGEWAAQVLMVKGTNLLMTGHWAEAVQDLFAATGEGSTLLRAIAHDGLATARWYSGDSFGALGDAAISVMLAAKSGGPGQLRLSRGALACFLAANGNTDHAARLLAELERDTHLAASVESRVLPQVAEILQLAHSGDIDEARSKLAEVADTGPGVRSSTWMSSLKVALHTDGPSPEATKDEPSVSMRAAAAGRAAAKYLGGGAPASRRHRPYLPAKWCVPSPPPVVISLHGTCRIERDYRPVEHPAWARVRVRELCLHLALVRDRNRAGVAAALWGDRGEKAAGQNLRVNLTHLLDVIDPERTKAKGSDLIVDGDGALTFSRDSGLYIDLWDTQFHADAILSAPQIDRQRILAHARRLITTGSGPLLGGAETGEWLEPHRRRLNELAINGALRAGDHAVAVSDHELTQSLGQWVLTFDPWSEQAHALVVKAHLGTGDRDGARRTVIDATSAMRELGIAPGPTITELTYRLGLSRN